MTHYKRWIYGGDVEAPIRKYTRYKEVEGKATPVPSRRPKRTDVFAEERALLASLGL